MGAVRGALHLGFAGLLLLYPLITLVGLPLAFGLLALADAAACTIPLVDAGWPRDRRRRFLLLKVCTSASSGLLLLVWPILAPERFYENSVLLVVAWALLTAGIEGWFAFGLKMAFRGERMTGATAALAAVFGMTVLSLHLSTPSAGMLSYGPIFIGYALIAAVLLLVQSVALREVEQPAV